MLRKGPVKNGRREVTFTLTPEMATGEVFLCGDFNEWSQHSLPMAADEKGNHSVTVKLEAGRRYRYRYLVDGSHWENDWEADAYVANEFGGEDSALDT